MLNFVDLEVTLTEEIHPSWNTDIPLSLHQKSNVQVVERSTDIHTIYIVFRRILYGTEWDKTGPFNYEYNFTGTRYEWHVLNFSLNVNMWTNFFSIELENTTIFSLMILSHNLWASLHWINLHQSCKSWFKHVKGIQLLILFLPF